MLREALRVTLTFIMKNHVHTFDNEIRKQTKGGPTGLKLTGVLAQIFHIWWDKEFAARLCNMNMVMTMNQRYVDDINLAVQFKIELQTFLQLRSRAHFIFQQELYE